MIMTPTEKIDAALDAVLMPAMSSTHYIRRLVSQTALESMREAMRKIMTDSFNDGIASTLVVRELSNDAHEAMKTR
jgi:hypothetical protein